jgi:hypothetical protein
MQSSKKEEFIAEKLINSISKLLVKILTPIWKFYFRK